MNLEARMNWSLVARLSLFGLAMAFGTVFLVPPNVEPLLWLAIFLVCAVLIARGAERRHFLHGLALGLVNCVWVTGAHVAFAERYLAGHADEARFLASTPLVDSPRLMMALTGPVIGVISGAVIGLLALGAARLLRWRAQA
jgi:hypothetical protein